MAVVVAKEYTDPDLPGEVGRGGGFVEVPVGEVARYIPFGLWLYAVGVPERMVEYDTGS